MKSFNIHGNCIPNENFMVDTSEKINKILAMVEAGNYFVINRPRQYGKTTTLNLLRKRLLQTEKFLPILLSFEGVGEEIFKSEECFCKHFLDMLARKVQSENPDSSSLIRSEIDRVNGFMSLSMSLEDILSKIDKKLVIMIDEVDRSSDNRIFIHFLGMLRNKYLSARSGDDVTFHSVILACVTDIKNLKLKIRPDEERLLNSPWNIAVDFAVDMSFSASEIETMLIDYVNDRQVQIDTTAISERIYFWTSGYPFLVSKLCKMIDEELLPARENKTWETSDVDTVVDALLRRENTLFDDIAKNLANYKDLYSLVKQIIFGLEEIPMMLLNTTISISRQYGIIDANEKNKIKIHNRIFEEVITDLIVSNNALEKKHIFDSVRTNYITKQGLLDFDTVMLKFQEAIKEKYHSKSALKSNEFLEEDLRLLFLVYLKPIINGHGFSFKEVQTGAERRLDVVVIFKNQKFVVELKLWHGNEAHSEGIIQLKEYMKAESIEKGYMLIMNKNKNKEFKHWIEDEIFCVMV